MPLYDFECREGHKFERMVRLEDFDETQSCACGSEARRLISTPLFSIDSTGYNCPITGSWIGSKHAHQENLARHGCRVLEAGERELNEKNRQAAEASIDKSIEDTVERTIESWGSDKKEALHNELVNGKLDLSIERY